MPVVTFDCDNDGRLVINAPGFSFGRLTTNDLVTLLSPQTMIWRGRADGVINSGGLKLVPEELEALYAPVLGGRAYYVKGVNDNKWGRAVALVIEAGEAEAQTIASALRNHVSDHRLLPKVILPVVSLPRTANGKVKRLG